MAAALTLTALKKSFGPTAIIRGLSLTLQAGERHALIGPNGAGKSTLFDLISGHSRVSAGRIYLQQKDITNQSPARINRLGLARSFQRSQLFSDLTVFEHLRCGLLRRYVSPYVFWRPIDRLDALRQATAALLEQIGLTPQRHHKPAQLTYAEQRTLELGLTLTSDATLILLDEPTAGMSPKEAAHALQLICRLSEGKTLLIIEHDMQLVFELADRVSVLVDGALLATGTPQAIREHAGVRSAYLGQHA